MHGAAEALAIAHARSGHSAIAIGVFVTAALRRGGRRSSAHESTWAGSSASAAIVRVGIGIDAACGILAAEHSGAARRAAITRTRVADAVFPHAASRSITRANTGRTSASGAARWVRGASAVFLHQWSSAAGKVSAAIIAASAAIRAARLGIDFATIVIRADGGRRAIGKTQITRGNTRRTHASSRGCIRAAACSSASTTIKNVVEYDRFATIIGHGRGGLEAISKAVEACWSALPHRASGAHGIGARANVAADAAIAGRCLQIDFASVCRIIIAIGEIIRAGQSTHATCTRRGRIGSARTGIAARAAIADGPDIDFTTVAGRHIAIGEAHDARFDGAHAHDASFIGIGQITGIFAESTILSGFNGRLTTVALIAVAISRSGAARIVFTRAVRTRLESIAFVSTHAAIVRIGLQDRFATVSSLTVAVGKSPVALTDAARARLALPHGIGRRAERIAGAAIGHVR